MGHQLTNNTIVRFASELFRKIFVSILTLPLQTIEIE
jgi:hypothetical protein